MSFVTGQNLSSLTTMKMVDWGMLEDFKRILSGLPSSINPCPCYLPWQFPCLYFPNEVSAWMHACCQCINAWVHACWQCMSACRLSMHECMLAVIFLKNERSSRWKLQHKVTFECENQCTGQSFNNRLLINFNAGSIANTFRVTRYVFDIIAMK